MHKLICYIADLYSRTLVFRGKLFSIGRNSLIFGWRVKKNRNVSLIVGEDSIVKAYICFEKEGSSVNIGNRTFIGKGLLSISEHIDIGDDVMLSWGVTIADHNSHSIKFSERAQDIIDWKVGIKDWTNVKSRQLKVCNKAWIGFNAILLKGVVVGEGAIVGAGSVVTKDVAPWTIVAGNPAKVIREIGLDER